MDHRLVSLMTAPFLWAGCMQTTVDATLPIEVPAPAASSAPEVVSVAAPAASPSPTATPTVSPSPTPTPTVSPSPTPTPTPTPFALLKILNLNSLIQPPQSGWSVNIQGASSYQGEFFLRLWHKGPNYSDNRWVILSTRDGLQWQKSCEIQVASTLLESVGGIAVDALNFYIPRCPNSADSCKRLSSFSRTGCSPGTELDLMKYPVGDQFSQTTWMSLGWLGANLYFQGLADSRVVTTFDPVTQLRSSTRYPFAYPGAYLYEDAGIWSVRRGGLEFAIWGSAATPRLRSLDENSYSDLVYPFAVFRSATQQLTILTFNPDTKTLRGFVYDVSRF